MTKITLARSEMNDATIDCTGYGDPFGNSLPKITIVHGTIAAYAEDSSGLVKVWLFGASEFATFSLNTPDYATFDAWYQLKKTNPAN